METHNHTGYTSDRGSPAWKHTFTQEDNYTGSVGENIHKGRDLVLTLGDRSRIIILKPVQV